MASSVEFNIVPVDVRDLGSIQAARSTIQSSIDKVASSIGSESTPSSFSAYLTSSWSDIAPGIPRAVLTPVSNAFVLFLKELHLILKSFVISCKGGHF